MKLSDIMPEALCIVRDILENLSILLKKNWLDGLYSLPIIY